jgi:NO-binding membrane sensor protein with MHYT domain
VVDAFHLHGCLPSSSHENGYDAPQTALSALIAIASTAAAETIAADNKFGI